MRGNYPNMSYCINQNTLLALQQVLNAMREEGADFLRDLSRDEKWAFNDLFVACQEFADLAEELQDEVDRGEYDDSMDGDAGSALASVGWGTDEDYGYAGDEY